MSEEKAQISGATQSELNAGYFNEIMEILMKYHETGLFETPLCLIQGFNDFVETREFLQLGGFTDSKIYCYVSFYKDTGTFKKYHNGIEI